MHGSKILPLPAWLLSIKRQQVGGKWTSRPPLMLLVPLLQCPMSCVLVSSVKRVQDQGILDSSMSTTLQQERYRSIYCQSRSVTYFRHLLEKAKTVALRDSSNVVHTSSSAERAEVRRIAVAIIKGMIVICIIVIRKYRRYYSLRGCAGCCQ